MYLKYKKYKKKYLNLLRKNKIAGAAAEQPMLKFDNINCNDYTSNVDGIKELILNGEKNITDTFIVKRKEQVENTIEIHFHTNILCSMGASKRIYYGIYRIIKSEITNPKSNETAYLSFDLKINSEITVTDEPVAIHEILTNDIDRLLNELRIYFKLDHENILKPYHIKKTDDKLYMYSQIGKNVFDVTMDNIKNFIKQMLSGLSYLHSQNPPIIHRDFKLGNIIKIGNTYKIIDFGLSTKFFPQVAPPQQTQEAPPQQTQVAPPQQTQVVSPEAPAQPTLERQTSVTKDDGTFTEGLGTLNYMAPELYGVKDVKYSEKTDTYALGITIINIIRKIKGLKQINVGASYQLHILSIYNANLVDEEKQRILNAEFYKLTCEGDLKKENIPKQPIFIDNIVTKELREFLTDCLLNPENRLTPTKLLETYQEFLSN